MFYTETNKNIVSTIFSGISSVLCFDILNAASLSSKIKPYFYKNTIVNKKYFCDINRIGLLLF